MAAAQPWQQRQPASPFPMSFPSLQYCSDGSSQILPVTAAGGFETSDTLQKMFADETRAQASISMCLRLERVLSHEVSRRVTMSNLCDNLRHQLQETFALLEAAEATKATKHRELEETKKEVEHLHLMVEALFEKETQHASFQKLDNNTSFSKSTESEGTSEEGSDATMALPITKRKAEQPAHMYAPSPKRPFRRIMMRSPEPVSPRAATSPATPAAMNAYW